MGGNMVSDHGEIIEPNPTENITDGIPYLIKVASVSCGGCPSAVRQAQCNGKTETPQNGQVLQRFPVYEFYNTKTNQTDYTIDILTDSIINSNFAEAYISIVQECTDSGGTLSKNDGCGYKTFDRYCQI
uniref:Uncharacterized protein n=1 Tax=Acrobeloides nanus TaxID=290746 RepID=A0A914E3H0_9BILA